MRLNADLPAEFEDGALRAARQRGRADVFAEWNEQAVDLDPVTTRQLAFKRDRGLLRRARPDISPAVGHAMRVYVNVMLLYDKTALRALSDAPFRLRSPFEVPFAAISSNPHLSLRQSYSFFNTRLSSSKSSFTFSPKSSR